MTPRRQDGFVLIAVIWFVALLALASTIISGWLTDSLQRAAALSDRLAAEQTMIEATNQVAFMITASYFTVNGIVPVSGADSKVKVNPMGFTPSEGARVLPLDGRPFRFGTGVIELQDTKGLYNLADIDPYTFRHLMGYFGISPQESAGLLDKLFDYEGVNPSVRRINGASASAYRQSGEPAPRNAPLITPWEAYRVLTWDGQSGLWKGPVGFGDLTTVSTDARGFNPNTASVELLRSLPGIDDAAIDKLLRYREGQVISNLVQMEGITGLTIPINDLSVSSFPANTMRVELGFPNYPLTRVVAISLPPVGDAPYRIAYIVDLPQEPQMHAALAAPNLPSFPDFVAMP